MQQVPLFLVGSTEEQLAYGKKAGLKGLPNGHRARRVRTLVIGWEHIRGTENGHPIQLRMGILEDAAYV